MRWKAAKGQRDGAYGVEPGLWLRMLWHDNRHVVKGDAAYTSFIVTDEIMSDWESAEVIYAIRTMKIPRKPSGPSVKKPSL